MAVYILVFQPQLRGNKGRITGPRSLDPATDASRRSNQTLHTVIGCTGCLDLVTMSSRFWKTKIWYQHFNVGV